MFAPGAVFIARHAIIFGVPVLCSTALVRQLATHLFDIAIPNWALAAATVTGLPLFVCLRVLLRDWRHAREAAALGARLAPTSTRGKWPGNLDMLLEMMKIWEHGYPGDGLRDVIEECGPVVDLQLLTFPHGPVH
ncbi:hypothetical protein MKEN_00892700 [Mycena kentingensis (nom. inval.)]|nr:hypothetical protein MKEN_00892700 [Mycena kentingensis (nom. inval.)]